MKEYNITTVLFLSLYLLTCSVSCDKKEASYYPLNEGRTLEYQATVGSELGHNKVVSNLAQRELRRIKVTPHKVEAAGQTHFVFVAEDNNGIYEFATQKAGDIEPNVKTNHSYMLRYPIKVGTNWEDMIETHLLQQNVLVTLASKIESIDDVITVPAGTFDRCVKVKSVGYSRKDMGIFGVATITVEHYSWYAPGIGNIKSVVKESSNNLMVGAGEVTLQLKSYKIGKQKKSDFSQLFKGIHLLWLSYKEELPDTRKQIWMYLEKRLERNRSNYKIGNTDIYKISYLENTSAQSEGRYKFKVEFEGNVMTTQKFQCFSDNSYILSGSELSPNRKYLLQSNIYGIPKGITFRFTGNADYNLTENGWIIMNVVVALDKHDFFKHLPKF